MDFLNKCTNYLSEIGYTSSIDDSIHKLTFHTWGLYNLMLFVDPNDESKVIMSSWFKSENLLGNQHEVDYRGVCMSSLEQLKDCLDNSTMLIKFREGAALLNKKSGHVEEVVS